MDSCKDYLFVPSCSQCLNFLYDLGNLTAAHPASGIGNDTVSTELIASILYFDIGTHMLCCMTDLQLFIFLCLVNFDHMLLFFVLALIFLQHLYNLFFLIIAKNQIHSFVFIQFSLICLHIAPCCHHNGIRIHFFCFMQHLPGFSVCNIRHRTCIDQIYICSRFKRHNLVTGLLQKLLHGFYFIGIHFTA